MTKNVVVVESPSKAKTINKYLGSDYTVLASYGHVRDLPSKDGSVEPDADFAMHYEVDVDSKKTDGRDRFGTQRCRHALSRDRPRPRGRGHFVACA